MMWLKAVGGIIFIIGGLFTLIPFLGMVSIADGGGIVLGHFVPMVITFVLGASMIAGGGRLLEASATKKGFLGSLLAGGLLTLFGGFRACISVYWLWQRPDIWTFHGGDMVFWLAYASFGIFVAYRGLSVNRRMQSLE